MQLEIPKGQLRMPVERPTMNPVIPEPACFGYCRCCGKTHLLKQGNAREYCLALMDTLEEKGRIDFHLSGKEADPRLSLAYLFGSARGQMFGVLECADPDGQLVILKAFSGQYNGIWNVDGWTPPLLDAACFDALVCDIDKQIKALGSRINGLPEGQERRRLMSFRKKKSQNLMKDIHALYRVHNFRSEAASLSEFFAKGIPTGAGDCCAPKLLNEAAQKRLTPVSLAEFYWGRPNRSRTRRHKRFYSSCVEKCQPILGFMLCGMEP